MSAEAPAVLMTERLVIRELDPEDLEAVFSIVSSPLNTAYLPSGAVGRERAEAFILRAAADRLAEQRRRWALSVRLKETDELIGLITLTFDGELPVGQVGFIISAAHWRRGYASESVGALVRFAFLGLGLHRLYAEADDRNAASLRVLEKTGFRREGHFIKARRVIRNGRPSWASVFHYAMLAKEYLMSLPDGFHSATGID